jgi:acetyl esterase/lipase
MKKMVLAGLVAASAWGIRRHRQTRSVHPELRTASLYVPLFVDNRLSLAIGRRMFGGSTVPLPGVVVATATGTSETPDVLIYETPGRTRPSGALLWIHGGGLVLGRPETDHAWCSRIADELGVVVVSVRYRLAPEHPFPAGLDDCAFALHWLHDRADELGIDPARIAVGDASAGGGLAAALCQRAHDEGRVPIAFQLLVYPMLDERTTLRRERDIRSVFGWTPRSNRFGWSSYLGSRPGEHRPPPYAVPARRADLAGLPPAWIGVGDLDLFLDEDRAYAARLRAGGAACELEVVPGMYHGADAALEASSRAMQDFRTSMVDALDRAIGNGAPGA